MTAENESQGLTGHLLYTATLSSPGDIVALLIHTNIHREAAKTMLTMMVKELSENFHCSKRHRNHIKGPVKNNLHGINSRADETEN